MRKVRIVKGLPQAKTGMEVETKARLWNGSQYNWPTQMDQFSLPDISVNNTLQPVDREHANLEAEKGEQAIVNQGGIPAKFKVAGKRHSEGGTPLNLPSNSFIFSDTKDMKIKDPTILAQFGITSGVYTPADIAKKYDINKYRGILADSDSTDLQRSTAEMMIANYNLKLAKLGLVQESKKGFPQGIPAISMPYVEATGINPSDFLITQAQPEQPNPDMTAAYGGALPMAQNGYNWRGNMELLQNAYLESMKEQGAKYLGALSDVTKYNTQQGVNKLAGVNTLYDMMIKGQEGTLKDLGSNRPSLGTLTGIEETKGNISDLKSRQKEYLNYTNKLKTSLEEPKRFNTEAEYKASLLQPYSAEKKAAQADWLKNNPGAGYTYQQYLDALSKQGSPYSTTGAAIENIKPAVSDTIGLAAFKAKEYGGETLDQYDGGGKVVKKDATYVEYEDGSIKNIKRGIWVEHARSDWKPKTTVSTQVEDKDGKGAYIARPGEKTPEGLNPSSLWTKEQLAQKYNEMGIDYDRLSDSEAQAQLYDKADPFHKAYMWGHIGNTKKGLAASQQAKFDKWKSKAGENIVQYRERLTKEGYTPETLQKELAPFKGSFADSYRGLREAYLLTPEKEKAAVIPDDVKGPAAAAAITKQTPIAAVQQQGHDPWWLQDIVKTAGAAGDFFRVKKYAPWQATPGVTLPEPTFYDPTRELAANAEMANIGVQGAAAFNNPQTYAATFSQIQGQGAKNAADILGRYNNMNVGVANDFETRRTDIMNQAAANRAGLSTQLADKYTIMNQQFDNSKNMARQNLRQAYIDAVTNKNYTGNLNDLYDQYKVDPSVGGRIKWTHGRPVTPEAASDNDIAKRFIDAKKVLPGVSDDVIYKMITGDKGAQQNQMYDPAMMQGLR